MLLKEPTFLDYVFLVTWTIENWYESNNTETFDLSALGAYITRQPYKLQLIVIGAGQHKKCYQILYIISIVKNVLCPKSPNQILRSSFIQIHK